MGRELQKKKNRSSIPRHTIRRNPRIHKIKKFGSQIIAQNWNKNETLSQNYKRLGLTVKLNKPTGGTEKTLSSSIPSAVGSFPATSATPANPNVSLAPTEARIERDSTGKITNIVYGKSGEARLSELEDTILPDATAEEEQTTEVVKALIERASRGVKAERNQSEREVEWVERLVEKYGDDYARMARDRKMNPWQQSEGDIRKRVGKWKAMKAKEAKKKKVTEI